jgi:sterol desaturase/sphingolipid hydroxylase (fatty acid hydroxylase superfamily)
MLHPLLRLIATRPQLLADHAEAYAGLVSEDLSKTAAIWKWRIVLYAVALALIAVAVVLGGVALMLWAVTPPSNLQAPWALIAGPVVPLAGAIACMLFTRTQTVDTFADLKQQVAADLVMLREVSTS